MGRRNSRDLVLATARELWLADEDVHIATLVEQSGVSVGSVYHHFGDKPGILAALRQDAIDHYVAGLRAALTFALSRKRDGTIRRGKRGHRAFVECAIRQHHQFALEAPAHLRVLKRVWPFALLPDIEEFVPRDVASPAGFVAMLFGALFTLEVTSPDETSLRFVEAALAPPP